MDLPFPGFSLMPVFFFSLLFSYCDMSPTFPGTLTLALLHVLFVPEFSHATFMIGEFVLYIDFLAVRVASAGALIEHLM
jgi:hypothetical protein